jgi:hypothetical protein
MRMSWPVVIYLHRAYIYAVTIDIVHHQAHPVLKVPCRSRILTCDQHAGDANAYSSLTECRLAASRKNDTGQPDVGEGRQTCLLYRACLL